jgi:hypothetical protein
MGDSELRVRILSPVEELKQRKDVFDNLNPGDQCRIGAKDGEVNFRYFVVCTKGEASVRAIMLTTKVRLLMIKRQKCSFPRVTINFDDMFGLSIQQSS